MVNIKNILIDAYKIASLVSEYDVPDANQTQIAINELNDIIYNLNLDNYLPFTRNTVEFNANGSNTMTIGSSGCDITAETPVIVQKIFHNVSNNYNELKRVAYEDIFAFRKPQNSVGDPHVFSYDRTWPNGRLSFDYTPRIGTSFIIIYNKQLPEVTINSILDIPNEYGDLFKNMLATTLMRRHKVDPNAIIMIEEFVNSTLNKIKNRNSIDKIITWGSSYRNGYSNFLNPIEWR